MNRTHAFAAAIVAGWAAMTTTTAFGQGAPAGAIDVRSIAPSPTTTAEIAASASGMTRDERKQQTIKARQAGTLKPAGEAGEFSDDAANRSVRREAAPASVRTAAAPMPEPRAQASATNVVKAGGPPAHRAKKSTAKASGAARHPGIPVG